MVWSATYSHYNVLQASLADSFVDLVSQAVIAIADIRCTFVIACAQEVSGCRRQAGCTVAGRPICSICAGIAIWSQTQCHHQPHEHRAKHADPRFPVGKARLEAVGVILCACLMTLSSFEVGLPVRMWHVVLSALGVSLPGTGMFCCSLSGHPLLR